MMWEIASFVQSIQIRGEPTPKLSGEPKER